MAILADTSQQLITPELDATLKQKYTILLDS